MNNNKDCDKTTIRVQVSDAYRDIIIDWSKEFRDIEKEMFRQLAEFTGISLKKSKDLGFIKPPGNNVYPDNSYVHVVGHLAYCNMRNSYPEAQDRTESSVLFTTQDLKDKYFRDGDCFSLNTKMKMQFTLDELYVEYRLVHLDLIDETECSLSFCHHISNKGFLDKQAKITNSDIESYLRDQPRPSLNGIVFFTNELHDAIFMREREIHADLNIGQYFNSYCSFSYDEMFRTIRPRIYWPNRG
ncbi:uncharacterized protein LOC107367860 isoform X1 [Tetranychus urticae]|uniref:Uncharacterized protein n=1 Tax=Tetranychus urticae TaxID=32264 RepID=T1KWA6_TETUR|nr:uncharacterized protein LOC107367860 isoform X1 [Tetranychus urticae]